MNVRVIVSSAGVLPRARRQAQRFVIATCVLSLLAFSSIASAIDLGPGLNGPFTFDDPPPTTDFSAVTLTGGAGTYASEAALTTAIQARSAASIASALPTDPAASPVINNGLARWNSSLFALETGPTGTGAQLLMAKFVNMTDNYISDFLVSYDVATFPTPAAAEDVGGHAVYYSLTGATNSWIPFDNGNGGASFGASGGFVSFFATGLGQTWGNNTMYMLFVDDNGPPGDSVFTIDNMTFETVLGDPKDPPPPPPPPAPFGRISPTVTHTFTEASNTLPAIESGGGVVTLADGPGGAPNEVMRVNNSGLDVVTDLVDLRNVSGPVTASIDFKTLDITTGFETGDTVRVYVEHSVDGTVFEALDLIPLTAGADVDPDPLKLYDRGELGEYFHFEVQLPGTAKTARIVIAARNDSGNETYYFDNLRISGVVVPEPGSVAMLGFGAIGLVGYGIRRRRVA